MADPSCFVITASEWYRFTTALAFMAVLYPVFGALIFADWLGWLEYFRRRARCRRIRAIRKARS